MSEPDFSIQSAVSLTPAKAKAWIRDVCTLALEEKGMRVFRASIRNDPAGKVYLVEAWANPIDFEDMPLPAFKSPVQEPDIVDNPFDDLDTSNVQ
jgi:hypothetical protein